MRSYVWSAGVGTNADEMMVFLSERSVTSSQLVKVRGSKSAPCASQGLTISLTGVSAFKVGDRSKYTPSSVSSTLTNCYLPPQSAVSIQEGQILVFDTE